MSGWIKGGGSNAQKPIIYSGLNVSSSVMDLPLVIFWGQRRLTTNALWYNDFQKHAISAKGKGGGGKGSKQYDYTAAVILALGEGVIDSIVNVWAAGSTTTTTTLAALNMTFFNGTAIQSPWSFVVTKYPTQARAYPLTSYLACPKMDLGSSATIPDNAFECVRANGFSYTHTSDGWINPATGIATSAIDCLLSDIILDLLSSPQYGYGFGGSEMNNLNAYGTYQRAQGLFFSPKLNQQEKVTSVIDRWAQLSNSWIYWSGTQFQFVPLGDSAVTGNGVTYTPDLVVAYDLGLSDFIDATQPVKVARVDPADCYNRCVLQITDRTIGYISNPLEYKDQTLIDQYGQRDASSTQADEICDPIVGYSVVQLLGKRASYLRNTYSFKTSYRYIRCLPGTIVTLTEPNLGLNKVRVRICTVDEDDNDNLAFTAEEFPGTLGTVTSPTSTTANPVPTVPNEYMLPGNVNTPAVVEPNSNFTGGVARLIVAASGGANWGGCQVNISFDGTTYQHIGDITSAAPQGLLTSGLASHADPDTVNTLAVDCTESLFAPQPVTNADADALRTLSLVAAQPTLVSGAYVVPTNGELLAFGAVASTGTYTANLTYLRRGQYGSAPSAHITGDQFSVIDVLGTSGTTVSYDLPMQYIGQPIYIKLASFNVFGNSLQDLSTVNEYKYTPLGTGFGTGTAGLPAVPTGLASTAGPGQNVVTWNANAATDNVTIYTLYAAPGASQPFSSAVQIFAGKTLTYTHVGIGGGVAYTYFLKATNAAGTSTNTAGVNSTSGTGYAPATSGSSILYGNGSGGFSNVSIGSGLSFVAGSLSATGGGTGTVTSVGLTLPSIFTVSGSPVTTTGSLTGTLNTQAANLVFAGPTTGAAATPAFRALVIADLSFAGSANGVATLGAGGFITTAQLPAYTGDVTKPSGSTVTTLANIPAISGVNLTNLNATNLASGTVAAARGGAGAISGILKANGAGLVSAAVSATDYAPATTGSSLLYGSSGGFASATVGSGLTFTGGALANSAAYLMVSLASNQSITASTVTRINFDTVAQDGLSGWDVTNKKYVPNIAGRYRVTCNATFAGTYTLGKLVAVYIYKNTTAQGSSIAEAAGAVGNVGIAMAGVIISLNGTTDSIEARGYCEAVAPSVNGSAPPSCIMCIEYLGP